MIELVTISVIITFIIFFVCKAIFSYIWDKKTSKQEIKSSNALFEEYVMDKEAMKQDVNKNAEVAEITKSEREENTEHILNNELLGKSVESEKMPLVNKLMGYDNARLNRIINNPKLYNQEVVDKAVEILGRREAWEQIKDFTDSELLEIAMTDSDLYAANVIEAASMELYQRDSQLLHQQFMQMFSSLPQIASGTAPAPEGIRLAAQKYLSQNK